jgi:4-hydroxy-tetrahydrodipicolinate reductase
MIGLIGMGKMGQAIQAILEADTGTEFMTFSRISEGNLEQLKRCDVVIEFTVPEAAPGIIMQCLKSAIPIVSGTTGWHEYHLDTVKNECRRRQGKLLYASNFSIGMNIVFALNRRLAAIMKQFPQFEPSLREIHHIHKKDSPSGTAYSLINDILENSTRYQGFLLNPAGKGEKDQIPVTAIREGEVKGYHEVIWDSGAEQILISHEAKDRRIFAEGALMAARWLKTRDPGVYTMRDIIQL